MKLLFHVVEVTKSLPNVIKSGSVLITEHNFRVIEPNQHDNFAPIGFKKAVEIDTTAETQETEIDEDSYQMHHQQNASDKLHEMQSYAEKIVEDARQEAEQIYNETFRRAEADINQCKMDARQEGYEVGLQQAQEEVEQLKCELAEKEKHLNNLYDENIMKMQTQITELLIQLVAKITGVVIEEKSIITYLVCDAVKGQSGCNEFRISVSKADYPIICEQQSQIEDLVKSTAQVTIIENPELMKNQCKIETEKNIIDCGIDTKMENLMMSLKLLI